MDQISIIKPVFTLILWTFTIFLFLASSCFFLLRKKYLQTAAYIKDLRGLLPSWNERLADNYTHLLEQTVTFYAGVISIAIINSFDLFIVQLTWAFVTVRIIHSIVQLTFNFVPLRFFLFCMGWLILTLMLCYQITLFA